MLAVHFGAGNIGRGFIGLLLARSGYQVCFVDVNPDLLRLIRERQGYTVRIMGARAAEEVVTGVTAIDGRDTAAVARAIAQADLVTTSVGPNVLPHIAPAIAEGLRLRQGRRVNVIACENMVGASRALQQAVNGHLANAELRAAFPNAVVDRIVPNFKPEPGDDPLTIAVESFYEWLVDEEGFEGLAHPVEGLRLVRNLPAYTERKLFGLNMGHATVAYLGYLKQYQYIHEAVRDPLVRSTLMEAFVESGLALVLHHGFTEEEESSYLATVLSRFGNAALADKVERVGRDPMRKLNPADRLVRPAKMAEEQGIIPRSLARSIAAAFLFNAPDDPTAPNLATLVEREGLNRAMETVSGITPDSLLGRCVREEYALLGERFAGLQPEAGRHTA